MNDDKYRVYLKTRTNNYTIANGTTVNGLLTKIGDWLEAHPEIKDDELVSVTMQTLAKLGGLVKEEERGPVNKRSQISKVAEALGAR